MARRVKLSSSEDAQKRVERYSNGRERKPRELNPRLPAVEEGSSPIDPESDNIYQEADRLLRRTMAHLELLQTVVEKVLAEGMGTPSLLKEAATISRTIAGISAELRQREKFAQEVIESMTHEEIDELVEIFFREADKHRRAKYEIMLREINKEEATMLGH